MAANVYYSVCPFGTGNLLTGGSPTIVVDASGNATLTLGGASQVDNIGIGVAVVYNSITSYISEITDATHFKLVSALGVTASNQTSTAVTSINHEYASLSALEAGFTDSNHINSTSLVSADVNIYACCYYDHIDNTADTTAFRISFGNTSNTQRFKIYVPNGGSESINVQRSETGVFDTNKAYFQFTNPADANSGIYVRQDNVDLVGIQVELISTTSTKYGIGSYNNAEASGTGILNIESAILRNSASSITGAVGYSSIVNQNTVNIKNTIFYDFSAAFSRGVQIGHIGTYNLTNSTIYNCLLGCFSTDGTANILNSAFFSNSDDINGTPTSLTYSCGDDSDFSSGTGNFQITQTATDYAALVTDAPNGDFSITDSSSELYNAGTNTGATSTDIIGTARPQATTTDIGAFELVVTSGVTVDATLETISISGNNPTVTATTGINSTLGTISISGLNANIAIGTGITSTLGLISISAFNTSISVGTGITATTGQLTISSLNPSLSIGTDINSTLGAVTISGINPSLSVGTDIYSTLGTVAIAGLNTTVSTGVIVTATVGAISIAALNTSISEGIDVDVTTGAISVTGLNPSIQTGLTIEPNTCLISITGFNPSISAGADINATLGTLSISGLNATVDFGAVVSCTPGAVNISGLNTSISAATTVNVTQGLIGISGLKTNIALATDINVNAGTIGITALSTTITTETNLQATLGLISILGYNPVITITDAPIYDFVAAPEKRTFAVPVESRSFSVTLENRTFTVT